jgi:BMFP domain-containing protein YqiC
MLRQRLLGAGNAGNEDDGKQGALTPFCFYAVHAKHSLELNRCCVCGLQSDNRYSLELLLAGCVPHPDWRACLVFQALAPHFWHQKTQTLPRRTRRAPNQAVTHRSGALREPPKELTDMNNFFNDLQGKINEALENSPAKDIERNVKAMMTQGFSKLDLVTREEFDIQAQVLAKTRAKLEALEARLAELEARLAGGAVADAGTGAESIKTA